MEILAQKLAELLDVGIDEAVKAYPVLRGQLIAYEMVGVFTPMLAIAFVMTIVVAMVLLVLWLSNMGYDNPKYDRNEIAIVSMVKRVLPKILFILVSIGIMLVLLKVTRLMVSPDIVIIKSLM